MIRRAVPRVFWLGLVVPVLVNGCGTGSHKADAPTCAQYKRETPGRQRAYTRHIYAGTLRALRSEAFAIDDKTSLANLRSAPARPTDQIVEQMAADIVTVCGLPNAHPGIELANAYLTGRATLPAG